MNLYIGVALSEAMKLEDLEKNLYKKTEPLDLKAKVSGASQKQQTQSNQPALKNDWQEEEIKEENSGPGISQKIFKIGRWPFWLFIVFALGILAFAGYYFYHSSSSSDVAFSVSAPAQTMLAVPFDLNFNVKNASNNILKDVKVSMVLPEGVGFVGQDPNTKRALDQTLGDLNVGEEATGSIPLVIFSSSSASSAQKFDVDISYYTPSLGASVRFEDTKTASISVGEPALKLDLVAPERVYNNKNFELEVHYQNISDIDLENAKLILTYPSFFTFKSASVNPSSGNNVWDLGDLAKNGNQNSFTIDGKVLTANQSYFEIRGALSAEISGQRYTIGEKTADFKMASSPLLLSINLNNQANYIASAKDNLNYQISYTNSSGIGLNDVVIQAKLIGAMFDLSTYQGNGFLDSKNNTITWNAANTPALSVLSTGANGLVSFQIKTEENYPITRMSDKNFILELQAQISSPTVPAGLPADENMTVGLANLKTNVRGQTSVKSFALYRDSTSLSSGINNSGNLPPKVNTPTDFTIHWQIMNYSTDISNVLVSAYLPAGVKWTGQVKSNIPSVPTYNENTGQLSWSIDKIFATNGVVSSPTEAVFQVEATPNITQVNQPMPILSAVNLQANDNFTNVQLTSQAQGLTTNLTEDKSVAPNQGVVVP